MIALKPAARPGRRAWWAAAAAGLLVIGGVATWQLQRSEYFWRNPLEGATVTRLTDFEGAEHHAAIFEQTLDEEKATDQLLTSIAERGVNPASL